MSLQKEDLIIKASKKYKDDLTVICLGPLTNIANALKKDPKLAYRLKHLVIMGTTYDPEVKKPYLELDREKKAQEKEEKKNDSYKKYEESLVYYGTLKQQYLDRLQKKKGE